MSTNPAKILIVDDLPRNIQIVASILERQDYDLAGASSGKMALEQLQNGSFDLVLLDVMMPEMDGFEVCRVIKEDPNLQHLHIIFLTAKTETNDLVEGFEVGASDYITKPFQAKELITRVRNQLALKRALDELENKNKLLKQANVTRDKFFSLMAHDLKAPFNGMIGMSQYILEAFADLSNQEIKDSIHQVWKTAVAGAELTEQLLNWARSQTGQLDIQMEAINLNTAIDSTLQLLYENVAAKNISLHWEATQPNQVTADLNMTSTVLRNLLSNAIKFTPEEGKVTLWVETSAEETIIVVQDTGIGIPEADYPKLFNLSSHYTRHGTNLEMGTGLGLILCKEFMKNQGGSLSFSSIVGEGSSFMMHFPHTPL